VHTHAVIRDEIAALRPSRHLIIIGAKPRIDHIAGVTTAQEAIQSMSASGKLYIPSSETMTKLPLLTSFFRQLTIKFDFDFKGDLPEFTAALERCLGGLSRGARIENLTLEVGASTLASSSKWSEFRDMPAAWRIWDAWLSIDANVPASFDLPQHLDQWFRSKQNPSADKKGK